MTGLRERTARALRAFSASSSRASVQVRSGRLVDLYDPDPSTIRISDVAHALAHQGRFNGHTREFYSVAQHSVCVSHRVPAEDALWGLLHDAAEAYVGDVVSPVKRLCPELEVIERRIMAVICDRYRLPHEMPASVAEADARQLATEARDLLTGGPRWPTAESYADSRIVTCWGPEEARLRFMERLGECCAASLRRSS